MSEFKNSFAEHVFNHKYARYPGQTWAQKAKEIVDDVCGRGAHGQYSHKLMADDDRKELERYIREFKFLPGGRYIYYAGRTAAFWNNCLRATTRILTDAGWRRADEVGMANVLSPVDGSYYPAEFMARGKQQVQKITFRSLRGHQSHSWETVATRTHHWPLVGGGDTYDLRIGDVVPANTFTAGKDEAGFVHGFMFGDGNANGQLRLCGAKKKYAARLEQQGSVACPPSAKGDPVFYFPGDTLWKQLPPSTSSPAYVASFIEGWLCADGSETTGCKLNSVDRSAIEWFRNNAAMAGIVITGDLRSQIRDVSIGKYRYTDHEIFIQTYQRGAYFPGFKVTDIVPLGEEEVYCPREPVHGRIVIEGGIDTFQCYLLRAEEDTREEWANVAWRATSCLMVGGGIGVDYSIIRPKGSLLSRTGGVASGPIPLIEMVNEIGRRVMQGGSRRSAIYGSLNWQHADTPELLARKNWNDHIVGSSGVSFGDLKRHDFNFPAPLDMTNISLNYDDAWLERDDRASDPIFLQNVRQALQTGEPGFSFNFGEKQNETLRNACTEISSEDDSDVCNLGSVNMGAIESLAEFESVVTLASKFLVCGTVRATLPYEKVYKVRDKNRRLGLGLMGVHEWLLRRGLPYGCPSEMVTWLETYQSASEASANEHCDRFFLSRPKGYRAIAPTGTIGILAGTTTGIEPLFAVAYRRRYLTEGTRWKYEFVVDSTADLLIAEHGLDPAGIETAVDLAADPERRISTQAAVQRFVDHAISSTINLPAWNSEKNNEDGAKDFAAILAKYAPRLRGFTCYPDGSRGGQPITPVPYEEARKHRGTVFEDNSEMACKDGVCGI